MQKIHVFWAQKVQNCILGPAQRMGLLRLECVEW